MTKQFTTRHDANTIDEYLRKYGYTISRDFYTKCEYTLRKEDGNAWFFDQQLNSKQELVDFANSL